MKTLLNGPLYLPDALKNNRETATIILGGGLAGLSAGFVLARAGNPVIVVENDPEVGGLSKTVVCNGFRFDLGGHRFITKSEKIRQFVDDLLDGEFLTVARKSKIYMRNRMFDYPLRPSNAVFGLGIPTTVRAITDYSMEKLRNLFTQPENVSLEDWVVSNFGRTLFNLYFKEYSEKVWGIECTRISKEWVAQRIRGLSLWVALKNAFFNFTGQGVDTLADKFMYPRMGIGQISDSLKTGIEEKNSVLTNTRVSRINHGDFIINSVDVVNCGQTHNLKGMEFVSSIPLTNLLQMLDPAVPGEVLEAASRLKYRDLVIVTIMLDRERVTDLTWMYLPEKDIPLGRIHEPKNWSPDMAPQGKTHIVSEFFCFENDDIWNSEDRELVDITVKQMEKLGLLSGREVIDSCVIRVRKAYPIFEVGYAEHYNKVVDHLKNFKNLQISGRGGMFRYYNMDSSIESGIEAAEKIMKNSKLGNPTTFNSALLISHLP